MKVSRGDVVLVEFPFSSGAERKLRPAVVVQAEALNRRLATTLLAAVTTNTSATRHPSQVHVDVSTVDGKRTGLLRPSAIKCENLATVETVLIRRKIGVLSVSLLADLDRGLKAALGGS